MYTIFSNKVVYTRLEEKFRREKVKVECGEFK